MNSCFTHAVLLKENTNKIMLYAAQNEKAWSLISDLSEMTRVISAAADRKKQNHTQKLRRSWK